MRGRRHCAAAVLAALAAACSGGDAASGGPAVVVDTVDGVPRLTSVGEGAWEEGDAWSVGGPVLTIGSVEGDPRTTFGDATGMALSSDGRLYVADSDAATVRVFDGESGAWLADMGRRGEGPGEFRYPDGLALLPGGTVAVRDAQGMSVSLFEPGGAFVRSLRLRRPFFQLGGGDGLWADTAGRIYDRTSLEVGGGGADSLGVMIYSGDAGDSGGAGAVDTVLAAVWEAPSVLLERDGTPVARMPIPFVPSGAVAVGPAGTVYATTGETYDIRVLDRRGDHVLTLRRDLPPERLDGPLRDSAAALMERRVEALVELGGGGTLSDWSLPDVLPFVSTLFVDELGHLWVGRDGSGTGTPTRFDVFDPQGRFQGEVRIPVEDFRVRQIGADFILGERRDALDVEQAVVLPLSRGRGR